MPKSDRTLSTEELNQIQEKIGELAKHALIEAGDLRDLEERLKAIAERSQKASDASQDGKVGRANALALRDRR